MNQQISDKVIGRLGQYRRLLNRLAGDGTPYVFSHELAGMAKVTAAQVRRDLMVVGCSGNPAKGYHVISMLQCIESYLDAPEGQNVALVGVGNLGRALLAFFAGRNSKLRIVAAFDNDKDKTGRVMHGCRCYSIRELGDVIKKQDIGVGVITVPSDVAQEVTDEFVESGICGILNFAPVKLQVPSTVYVEDIDMTVSMERVAFMARHNASKKENRSECGEH